MVSGWKADRLRLFHSRRRRRRSQRRSHGHHALSLQARLQARGCTHFNDNQRLHIFVVDIASKQVRQLTQGNYDEHSIDWSPDGKQLVFASNREPNQDEFFNYDLFTLQLADNSIHRLTATESCEYDPLWSPDGKTIVYLGTGAASPTSKPPWKTRTSG